MPSGNVAIFRVVHKEWLDKCRTAVYHFDIQEASVAASTKKERDGRSTRVSRRAQKSQASDSIVIRNRRVARWGNSLGFRIPQEAADQLNLKEGEEVSIEVHKNSMTITPARKKWTEDELLKGVTPDMVGGEIDWGGPVGKEVW